MGAPAATPSAAELSNVYRGRRALVTGGLGFIGSHVSRRLVMLGAKVTIMDSMIPDYGGNRFNIHDFADVVTVNISDVRDRSAMNHLVQGQDFLFNLAGQVSHIDSMRDPFTDLDINCRSQLSILEACRENNRGVRIVFAASRQEYGRPQYLPVDEQHPVRPVDVNGINKVAGEWYHLLYNDVHDLHAVSLRLTNTYGAGQLVRHNRQGFIGWFIRTVVEGGTIELYGDGSQLRDLNHVQDVAEAFVIAGASDAARGRIYNLAAEPPVSLRQIAETLVSVAGKGAVRFVEWPPEKRAIDIGSYYGTHALITRELGWRPEITLDAGLRRTVAYYDKYLKHYV
ncbi:MAG: NAD-dependent epimerase/dehydratase family protein [Planctomycetota bacterium]